jgi:hypothetical protein
MTLKSKPDALKSDFEAGRPPYNEPHSAIEVMHQARGELLASFLADKAAAFTLPEWGKLTKANGMVAPSRNGIKMPQWKLRRSTNREGQQNVDYNSRA